MKKPIEIAFAAVAVLAAFFLVPRAEAAEVSACTTETIVTKAGPVCGTLTATASGRQAEAFLGIPFGESTARARRWTPPVPKRPWMETLAAVKFGAICPQSVPGPQAPSSEAKHGHKLPAAKIHPPHDASAAPPAESEDCLSLNVWVPADASPDAGLPVMVFIYGGSFVAGASADPLYDGAYLAANRNVILVSFNYRVGVLGFLTTDALSGNYGFLDQQLALAWVRDNIGAFGGDPAKVTIFGESAGAMSVGLHLFSAPGSTTLFRAGIMQSNFFALPYKRLEEQVNVGNLFKQGLGCRDLECLRNTGIDKLLTAQHTFTPEMSTVFSGAKYYIPFGPVIDGTVLTRQPVAGAADAASRKPVLMGTNKDEAVLFVEGEPIPTAGYASRMASLFGTAFQAAIARYPAGSESKNGAQWARVQTDYFLACSTRHVGAKAKGPIYAYLFDHQPSFRVWGGPACRKDGVVCHGDELPFVFHSADKIGGRFTAEEAKLSNAVMDTWTNFATYLDPNGDSAADADRRWPRYSGRTKNYLVLDTPKISVRTDPHRQTCAFWDGIGYNLTDPWAAGQEN